MTIRSQATLLRRVSLLSLMLATVAGVGLAVLLVLPIVWGFLRKRQGLPMFGSPTIAQLEDPSYRPGLVGMKKVDGS